MTSPGDGLDQDVPEGLVFTTLDIDKHAAGVAEMWNLSDANWPGTWTNGVPETAESVTRAYRQQECVETFLCLEGDVVGGYCKVMPDLMEPGVDYVALVNVPPSHQKKGVARRLLQRATRLAVERASNRLDLHTWPSNINAVPLYKKVGFMWMPDTDIHMLNFMPGILRLDAARDFFATRDWYRVFRRPLDQEPDEERWEGMKTFTYRFVDSPDDPDDAPAALVARVDREARAVCAIETPQYAVSARTDNLEPARGAEAELTWTIENRGAEPLQVSVLASGTADLLIDHRASVTVAPGATEVVTGVCRISPDAEDVRPGLPVPAVKSVLLIGDQVVELSTGLRPRDAFEITTWPAHVTLAPGTRRKIDVRLRSRLKDSAEVILRAAAAEGLELSWTEQKLRAEGEGWAGAELEVAVPADVDKAYALDLSALATANGNQLRGKPEPRHVYALGPTGLLTTPIKKGLRAETAGIRVLVRERAGNFFVDPTPFEEGGMQAYFVGSVGPPFSPSEFGTLDFELSAHPDGAELVLEAVGRSKRWPGFVLTRRLRLGGGPVVVGTTEAFNGEPEARTLQFRSLVGGGGGLDGSSGASVLPLASGVTRGSLGETFPGGDDDETKKPERLSEQWWAREGDNGELIGAVWAGDYEEVAGGGTNLLTPRFELAPGARATSDPIWLFAGSGSWRQVRALWRRRAGRPDEIDQPVEEPRQMLELRPVEGPALASADRDRFEIEAVSETTWAIGGELTLEAPEGWSVEPARIDTSELTWRSPVRVELAVRGPGPAAAGMLRGRLEGSELVRDLELPLLWLGPQGAVEVKPAERNGQPTWSVASDRCELLVAPEFGGATVSWKVDGVEQLASDFPEPTSIAWLLPWHGGISPVLTTDQSFPGYLWRESFESEEIEEKDGRGLLWRGVRVGATSTHENSRGQRVESDVLVLSGAPVLKHVVRFCNSTGASQRPTFGTLVFCAPGGRREPANSHSPGLSLRQSGRIGFNSTGNWAASENAETGATVLIAGRRSVGAMKLGTEGSHLLNLRNPRVAAGETWESVSYLVAAPSLEEALPWRALADLD